MILLSDENAISLGYSPDRNIRKQQHLDKAEKLTNQVGFFNSYDIKGTTIGDVAEWHKFQADNL